MKYGIVIIALAMMSSLPVFAGSARYNKPGASQAVDAVNACQPKINDATNALVMMRLSAGDSKGKQIQHELGMARTAMETGHAQECLMHVSNAVGLEQ
jgi:hypothetical protein